MFSRVTRTLGVCLVLCCAGFIVACGDDDDADSESAAVVSGAGPTVLALCDGVQAAEHAAEAARALTADGAAAWRVLVPCVAVDGVRVESLHHG